MRKYTITYPAKGEYPRTVTRINQKAGPDELETTVVGVIREDMTPAYYQVLETGKVVRKSDEEIAEVIKLKAVTAVKKQLEEDLHTYIDAAFDSGTQRSFLALTLDQSVPDEVKAQIGAVWTWLRDEVMGYYYAKKAEIEASTEPASVVWDFSQKDATKPNVTLRTLMANLTA